ncbi:MAG: DUF2723 domain-containing protein [candidate division Zixibacteria bacterium]
MKRLIPPLLIFVLAYVYYSIQACPSFYFWDSAELTAAVLTDGVPHPPGFPLLLLIAKLWLSVTPFEKVLSLNLFSSFMAAAGLTIWYFVIMETLRYLFRMTDRNSLSVISFISIVVLGITFSYSIQATRFEVYSLNFLLFAVIFYLALKLIETSGESAVLNFLFYGAVGLSLGAHLLTMALALPGIFLFYYAWTKWKISRPAAGIPLAVIIIVALYYYLYKLAVLQPSLNWGDPSNLGRFLDYLFVREFNLSMSSFSRAHLAENISFVARLIARQFGLIGIILALVGLAYTFIRKIPLGVGVSLILVLNVFSSVFSTEYFYENFDLHGYHLISMGIMGMCSAIGLTLFYGFLRHKKMKKDFKTDKRALMITAVVAVLIFAVPIYNNIFSADLSDVDGRTFAEAFLQGAPDNAMIITSYYNTYFCLLAYDAGYNPDSKRIIHCLYNWDHKWGREQAARRSDESIPVERGRQEFYRELLNGRTDAKPVYIEYDSSSRPLAKYIRPQGLGYIFAFHDSLKACPQSFVYDIQLRLKEASGSNHIEWIKTWVLWFNNRGLYYKHLGEIDAANAYFEAMNSLAETAEIE